tara:strand:- start:1503 stop:2429 length:927 start_codon:yes stop_codon:yes gene_type:complete
MKTGILLSYKGLGANLLHLSYCHEIAKKFGKVNIITLNPKLKEVLIDDPSFDEIIHLDKYYKKFSDIINLSQFLKKLKLDNLFIFYPSLRYFLSGKFAGIENVYNYPIFKKKNLHLVDAAKNFTEKNLNIKECSTETKIFIDYSKIQNLRKDGYKNIILGIGSSGPTTKWGSENFISLINELNNVGKFYFFLLCGPEEKKDAQKILGEVNANNCESLADKSISQIKNYVAISDLYIGNDSFGQHLSCQMGKPSFIILLDTPRAYSDYSVNQKRIIPPNKNLDEITHDSKLDPNTISVKLVINKIKDFI